MTTRGERVGQLVMLGLAALFAYAVLEFLTGGLPGGVASSSSGLAATPTASPTPPPAPPRVTVAQDTCCDQSARFLRATWDSSEPVKVAAVAVVPDPGFACEATFDASAKKGAFGCVGLLKGATPYVATLRLTTAAGTFPFEHRFKTMGDKLENVKWFTEFEDVKGEPLACAAASCRIIQNYTSGGKDPMTAEQILALGMTLNRSNDPGLDPVGVAAVLKRLNPANNYHYYRYGTREEATTAAVYWLLRSGKPVVTITLAGQHAPLLIGFRGAFGTFYDDPVNTVSGVVVQDPQRGDVRPETASRRPDKYRTPGFQTGQLIGLGEWYTDEWWFAYSYATSLAGYGNIDRNDGAYPTPHWARTFVLIVDDGDADSPSDREGRVKYR
ncbi:MAG: hypothetical protein EXR61_01785 [Chloroflexi bacterium]|nr:hypothetical protein [Chloroflexota bacterium]